MEYIPKKETGVCEDVSEYSIGKGNVDRACVLGDNAVGLYRAGRLADRKRCAASLHAVCVGVCKLRAGGIHWQHG